MKKQALLALPLALGLGCDLGTRCGDGSFEEGEICFDSVETLPLETVSINVAAQDIDGDGDADLIAVQERELLLLFNDGAGRFPEREALSLGEAPIAVTAGDLDGDGDADLAVSLPSGIQILDNQAGAFAVASKLSFEPSTVARALALGDVDGDGDLDVLAAGPGPFAQLLGPAVLNVFQNDGAAGFVPSQSVSLGSILSARSITLSDLDKNSAPEIIVSGDGFLSGSAALLTNDGAGRFTAENLEDGGFLSESAAGDIDGDGDVDLITTGFNFFDLRNSLDVLTSEGAGLELTQTRRFSVEISANELALLDLGLDGSSDAVLLGDEEEGGVLLLFPSERDGRLKRSERFRLSAAPFAVVSAELNGDGAPDLVVLQGVEAELSLLLSQP